MIHKISVKQLLQEPNIRSSEYYTEENPLTRSKKIRIVVCKSIEKTSNVQTENKINTITTQLLGHRFKGSDRALQDITRYFPRGSPQKTKLENLIKKFAAHPFPKTPPHVGTISTNRLTCRDSSFNKGYTATNTEPEESSSQINKDESNFFRRTVKETATSDNLYKLANLVEEIKESAFTVKQIFQQHLNKERTKTSPAQIRKNSGAKTKTNIFFRPTRLSTNPDRTYDAESTEHTRGDVSADLSKQRIEGWESSQRKQTPTRLLLNGPSAKLLKLRPLETPAKFHRTQSQRNLWSEREEKKLFLINRKKKYTQLSVTETKVFCPVASKSSQTDLLNQQYVEIPRVDNEAVPSDDESLREYVTKQGKK